MHEDDTVVSRAFTGKTCRVNRNGYTNEYDRGDREIKPFPAQFVQSIEDGANHLGAGPATEVDPDREFWPAGQGVGAIDSLVPAGELVRSFVAEAEAVLDRVSSLRSLPRLVWSPHRRPGEPEGHALGTRGAVRHDRGDVLSQRVRRSRS